MATTKRAYKIGDKVFCPPHGVGEICCKREEKVGGNPIDVYEISILHSELRVMVPVALTDTQGLRPVSDKKLIDKVLRTLKEKKGKSVETQTWNRRQREYTQKIKTGCLLEMVEVYRDLSVLSSGKELSFGEKKMLDQVEELLVTEISIAKSRPRDKVSSELSALFCH